MYALRPLGEGVKQLEFPLSTSLTVREVKTTNGLIIISKSLLSSWMCSSFPLFPMLFMRFPFPYHPFAILLFLQFPIRIFIYPPFSQITFPTFPNFSILFSSFFFLLCFSFSVCSFQLCSILIFFYFFTIFYLKFYSHLQILYSKFYSHLQIFIRNFIHIYKFSHFPFPFGFNS